MSEVQDKKEKKNEELPAIPGILKLVRAGGSYLSSYFIRPSSQ